MVENQSRFLAVYTVRPANKEGAKDFFVRIGTMFPHKDGIGFNITLDANPVNGKLVALPPREKDDAEAQQ